MMRLINRLFDAFFCDDEKEVKQRQGQKEHQEDPPSNINKNKKLREEISVLAPTKKERAIAKRGEHIRDFIQQLTKFKHICCDVIENEFSEEWKRTLEEKLEHTRSHNEAQAKKKIEKLLKLEERLEGDTRNFVDGIGGLNAGEILKTREIIEPFIRKQREVLSFYNEQLSFYWEAIAAIELKIKNMTPDRMKEDINSIVFEVYTDNYDLHFRSHPTVTAIDGKYYRKWDTILSSSKRRLEVYEEKIVFVVNNTIFTQSISSIFDDVDYHKHKDAIIKMFLS